MTIYHTVLDHLRVDVLIKHASVLFYMAFGMLWTDRAAEFILLGGLIPKNMTGVSGKAPTSTIQSIAPYLARRRTL